MSKVCLGLVVGMVVCAEVLLCIRAGERGAVRQKLTADQRGEVRQALDSVTLDTKRFPVHIVSPDAPSATGAKVEQHYGWTYGNGVYTIQEVSPGETLTY